MFETDSEAEREDARQMEFGADYLARAQVRMLCERIGYDRVIAIAAELRDSKEGRRDG